MKNNTFTFKNQFIDFIKAMIPDAKEVSGGTELVCHCKYCPDSRDPTHGHMYIKVPQSDSDPILFHCFKCNTSGLVDSRSLMEWGIYDPVMGVEIDKLNKKASRYKKYNKYSRIWYPFVNHITNIDLANRKLEYLNTRIGTNLSITECLAQKIVLNLKDVLDFNMISSYTRHPSIIDQLNWNFIGFLSLDNNFINMRRICDEGIVYKSIDSRYINYNIHDKHDNTEKMYILPTSLDLTNPERVHIHIAEGPFDILSIKYNLRKFDTNSIFAAITGSGYKGLVLYLINVFQIFYFDIHLYLDNDKDSDITYELLNIVRPYGSIIYEHRNLYPNEKDFGVPLDRISENIAIYK